MKKSIKVNSVSQNVNVSVESVLKASAVSNFIDHMDEPVFSNEPSFNLNAKQLKEMHDNQGSNNYMAACFEESLQVAKDIRRKDLNFIGEMISADVMLDCLHSEA